jgi:predicted GNAT family acetyltransferase
MELNEEKLEYGFDLNKELSFCLYCGKQIGYCEFESHQGTLTITHTVVDKEFGGHGIAKKLVLKVVEYARLNHLLINPVCSYASNLLEKEEYKDILRRLQS